MKPVQAGHPGSQSKRNVAFFLLTRNANQIDFNILDVAVKAYIFVIEFIEG